MNSRVLHIMAAAFFVSIFIGCAVPGPRVAIVKPQLVDEKAATENLLSKYCDVVSKTDRMGFEIATAMCRRIQTGEIKTAGVKSSANGQYVVYMFKEDAGAPNSDHSIIAFSFIPGSELIRTCNEAGLCDVHVRNGVIRFGRTNIAAQGEPKVNDNGIDMTFSDYPRSYAFDLLFSYGEKNKQEGNELIAIFLSAFPMLEYQ